MVNSRAFKRVNRIMSFGGAVRQCLVRYIYGVCAGFGELCRPRCRGGFFARRCCRCRTCRTGAEGIDIDCQYRIGISETGFVGCFPCAKFGFGVFADSIFAVIVDYQLVDVGVAFARAHDVGAGVCQHRHKERHDVTLCVKVFDCLEDTGTLPFPPV